MTTARQTLARAMTEKQLQANVTDALEQFGWLSYHTWMSKHSAKGFPDIVALRRGRGLAVELKIEGQKPTDEQKNWLSRFAGAGFETHVWYPSDWLSDEILEELR